jgi:4-hydroxy-tetrahydrodipicolinate reductase
MKSELIINGAAGRMGRRLIALAAGSDKLKLVAACDTASHPDIGKDAGTLAAIEPLGVKLKPEFPPKADIMIDFSLPQAADSVIDYCTANNIALVSGTTGLSDGQIEKILSASQKIPIVRASNFSIGMNLLFDLVSKAAQTLGDSYDIELIESHHKHKKDSPSGTALTLAENIARASGMDFPSCLVHGRQGGDALRQKGTIGIHAVRAGDIVGQHSVIYATAGESVTLSHNATSRDTFAAGAIRAAEWLIAKEPRLYSMADVIKKSN